MQVSTFAGLAVGVLIVGYTAGEALANLYDHTLLLLVVGGGIAATLVSYPLHAVLAAFGAARRAWQAGRAAPPWLHAARPRSASPSEHRR